MAIFCLTCQIYLTTSRKVSIKSAHLSDVILNTLRIQRALSDETSPVTVSGEHHIDANVSN